MILGVDGEWITWKYVRALKYQVLMERLNAATEVIWSSITAADK